MLLEIKLNENLESLEEIRTLLIEKKIEDFILNFSGSQNDVIIKISGEIESESSERLKSVLRENFEFDLRKEEFIGPQIGEELRDQGGLGLLLALLIFGGDAIQNFSVALIIGVIAGTYSSIYIANTILVRLNVSQKTVLKDDKD